MNNFYYFLQFYISTYLVQADRTNCLPTKVNMYIVPNVYISAGRPIRMPEEVKLQKTCDSIFADNKYYRNCFG